MKTCKYRAVLFDLDGTILNTLTDLWAATNYTMSAMNAPERTLEEVDAFVGNGIRKLIERALPEDRRDEETIARAYCVFCDYYGRHYADSTVPYPGVETLLKELKETGVYLGVVTNKADFAAKKLCEKFYPGVFGSVLGAREDLPRKPAPDGVRRALGNTGIAESETVFIGDSDVDYYTAKNAGTHGILVSWGFRKKEFLSALDGATICDDVAAVQKILY